jgi:N-acetylmuramoyl-L-alanine amidase
MKRRLLYSIAVVLLMGMVFTHFPLWAQVPTGRRLVVIDPGHGGADPGVRISEAVSEKDVTLAIALSLQRELGRAGNTQVRLTRSADRLTTTEERIRAVKEAKPDLFLSIHVNAGFGKGSTGYELYFPGFNGGAPERSGTGDILQGMARNLFLNNSVRLAQILQRNMEGVFPRKGRGLRDAPVPVLQGLALPGVVVEIGFATNPEDKKKLTDENVRKAVAQALSRGIQQYFSGQER